MVNTSAGLTKYKFISSALTELVSLVSVLASLFFFLSSPSGSVIFLIYSQPPKNKQRGNKKAIVTLEIFMFNPRQN